MTTVAQMLRDGVEQVDSSVTQAMGYDVPRRHWQEADNVLALAHKVKTTVGAHGRIYYQREQ